MYVKDRKQKCMFKIENKYLCLRQKTNINVKDRKQKCLLKIENKNVC